MSRRTLTIGELVDSGAADIQTGPFGTQLKANDYVDSGIPVINVRNIGYGVLQPEKLEFVTSETADRLAAHLLQPRDIVFGRKGAVDRHLYVSDEQNQWLQGSDCIRLRFANNDIVSRFVSYSFLNDSHQKWMLTQAGNKATMASLNHDIIKRITLSLPEPSIQHKIVDILSAYDDLIENNRRRMALLEESARLLYREWFVHFRFPGHEPRIVNGVPEGWERMSIASVCQKRDGIQTGPFGSQLHQTDYTVDGVPVVMPKNLKNYRIATEEIARIPEELAQKLSRHRLRKGDTVYGRRGDIGRRAFVSERQVGWLCGTGSLRIRPNKKIIQPRYLFDALGSPETAGIIANRAKGATMPNLNTSILKSVPLLVPTWHLQNRYSEHVDGTFEMMETLSEQTQKLTTARDLLLPRLMNGEISI